MTIILCGHAGCGKSTIAAAFAQAFDYALVDTDQLLLEKYQSNSIGELFESMGEKTFREREAHLALNLDCAPKTIIATGGGLMQRSEVVAHLKILGNIVYLSLSEQQLWQRLNLRAALPRFLDRSKPRADFSKYFTVRARQYEKVADKTLIINDESVSEIVEQLRGLYGQ